MAKISFCERVFDLLILVLVMRWTARAAHRLATATPWAHLIREGLYGVRDCKLDMIFTRMMSVSRRRLLGLVGARKVTEVGARRAAAVLRLQSWR
jgi:hypothetical protein